MKNLGVRLALLGLFVMAGSVAAYYVWTGEVRTRQSSLDVRAFEAAAIEIERAALDVRTAQEAYVAAGQGEEFWTAKVASATTSMKSAVEALRLRANSSAGQNALDAALSALDDFDRLDRRAREYVRAGQKLLAADLIFTDGLDFTAAISAAMAQARTDEAGVHAAVERSARRAQAISVGTAGLVALAVISLLIARSSHAAGEDGGSEGATRGIAPLSSAVGEFAAGAAAPDEPASAPEPAVDLGAIASVCSDLARVVETRALPALLGRAAGVLDASGVVLWIADPDGRELTPIVTHGYPQPIVLRLGTILRDAENATAAAFRTSLLQTVAADAVSNGAIAAPLVTPAGCVGVMAAEVRRHAEQDSFRLAAATIVAAQLATLVGPPSTRAQARADVG